MKKAFFYSLVLLIFSCSQKDQEAVQQAAQGYVEADISGGSHYSATTTQAQITTTTPKQLTVSSSIGTGTGMKTLSIALLEFDESNLANYSFSATSGKRAIGGYNRGAGGGDDIIINGTVQVTAILVGHIVQGTFTGTTVSGVQITNGRFSASY